MAKKKTDQLAEILEILKSGADPRQKIHRCLELLESPAPAVTGAAVEGDDAGDAS